jgi:RHS repeat-associated protein
MKGRLLLSGALALLCWTMPLLAEAGPGLAAYHVKMVLYPGDDGAAVAKRLAAMYRGTLETPVDGDGAFVIVLSPAAADLMRRDPAVERFVVADAVAAPAPVPETTATATPWKLGNYEYDGSGNIRRIGADFFVYDTRNRLVVSADASSSTPVHKQAYTYDNFGNLTTITTAGTGQTTLAVDTSANQVTTVSGGLAPAPLVYDAVGNLTRYGTATYTYDALNSLTRSSIDGVTRHYVYSANDERIGTVEVSSAGTRSDWTIRDPGGQVLRRFSRESSGEWKWQEDYIYRGTQMLAAEVPDASKTRHFHLDHLGTPRLITGNGGAELSRHNYHPFGVEIEPPSTSTTTIMREKKQFTGHERDAESLDYMHARFYAPYMGRFLSVDPVLDVKRALHEPQSFNRYSYVVNNPIRRIDPDGRVDGNSDDFARQLFPDNRAAQLAFDQDVAERTATASAVTLAAIYGGPPAWRALSRFAAVAAFQVRIALSGATTIMVGQTMSRVNSAANQTGSLTFEATGLARTASAIWTQNLAFLQNAVSKGYRIFDIGSNPALKSPGHFHPKEVEFLVKQGYHQVHAGWVMAQGRAVQVFEWIRKAN